MATVSTEVKPERVGHQAGEHGDPQPQERAEFPGRGKRTRSQQQGHHRQRQAHLFQEHRREHDRGPVVDEELSCVSHAAKPRSTWVLVNATKSAWCAATHRQ